MYSTRGSLKVHQAHTKACLLLSDDEFIIAEYDCDDCDSMFTSKQRLDLHKNICLKYNIRIVTEKYAKEKYELYEKYVKEKYESEEKNKHIETINKKILEQKDKEILRLDNRITELTGLLASRPTSIINNTNTNSNNSNNTNQVKNEDNRVLNVVTFLKEINKPITTKLLEDNVKHLTVHHCLGGGTGLADYALQFPLAETPIVCTDQNRHNFKYLDEFNGRVIVNEDKNLIQFNPRFFAAIKERSRVLLEEFAKDIDITDDEGLAKATEIANILKDINYSSRGDKTKISDDLVTRIATKTPFSVVMKMLNNQPRIEAAQTVTNTSTVEII